MKYQLPLLAVLVLVSLPTAAQPVVLGQYNMAYPFPSPDGTHLVFQGDFDGRWQLYTLTLDGGEVQRLSTSLADDTHPAYSPDGRTVAFISNEPGNDDVYLLNVETGERRPLVPHPGKDGHPKWSADGEWVVFNRTFDPADVDGDIDAAILRVRPDGTDLEVLSDSDQIETFPSFSPDGRFIVCVEWFPNAAGEPARNGELIKVEIETGVRTRLTDNAVFDAYPYWGGEWIYFTVFDTDAEGQRRAAVHRMSADGAIVEQVTEPGPIPDVRAIPSRDETQVFYNNREDGRTVILMEALPPRG
ncbi:MAG: hypothetical protein HKN04_13990 [Rhodothermaceae bacterium]|nr:hypothetical protein [Rhodothermaceae bacterium]